MCSCACKTCGKKGCAPRFCNKNNTAKNAADGKQLMLVTCEQPFHGCVNSTDELDCAHSLMASGQKDCFSASNSFLI
jgi:hypothetical protein